MEITQDYLKDVFDYQDGKLIYKKSIHKRLLGKQAGSINNSTGYHRTNIFSKYYATHRLMWLFHYGEWPSMDIDHKDMNKTNNRIENLRLTNDTFNSGNVKKHKNKSSIYKGVWWHKQHNKWYCQIRTNGKTKFLGLFLDEKEAAKAYDKEAITFFKEFARPNFDGVTT